MKQTTCKCSKYVHMITSYAKFTKHVEEHKVIARAALQAEADAALAQGGGNWIWMAMDEQSNFCKPTKNSYDVGWYIRILYCQE